MEKRKLTDKILQNVKIEEDNAISYFIVHVKGTEFRC